MAYSPLEDLLPKANNSVYRLVRIASKRAMEIAITGQSLNGVIPANQKLTTTAFEEIRAGKCVDKLVVKNFSLKKN